MIVLVTGATAGFGTAIARRFAADGARIVAAARRAERLEALKAELGADKVLPLVLDVRDRAAVMKAVEGLPAEWAAVDVLVNNAGIQFVSNVEDFPTERWDAIIAINLSSAFHTTRLALPHMQQQKWGRIINIASVHGLVASAGKSAYVAAKHGLIGLTKTVALETAKTGVTCNAICPGWVLTPLVQKQIDDRAAREKISVEDATRELLQEKEPSLKFTTPEQLGGLAVFFCSPATDNVTGQSWASDGGWSAQ